MAVIILYNIVRTDSGDPDYERLRYQRGQIIDIVPDGKTGGNGITWPNYAWILIPGISIATVRKYVVPQYDLILGQEGGVYRKRKWRVRLADLPQSVINKFLVNEGKLTIKAGSYAGSYDYTWKQVQSYFRDDETGLDETMDI